MPKNPAFRSPFAISFGAVGGALSRYYFGLWLAKYLGASFPYGTFVINVSGCFVMGFLTTLVLRRAIPCRMRTAALHPDLWLLVTTGFIGSYTTFSTYEIDTASLLSHDLFLAFIYWFGTALLGLLSLLLGNALAGVRFTKRSPKN
jgi:fluoride exporter